MKKRRIFFLLPILFCLTSCADAIRSELNADALKDKLIPSWASFVIQLAALLVLILIVIIFAYKPIKKIINKRKDYIENEIKEAEKSKATWQENELKSKETVLASNRTAADIVAEAKANAEVERQKILDQAAADAEKMKKDAENDIARMEVEAQEQIKKEMVAVALDASKELLGREVTSEDNNRLLEEFIEDIKK